MLKQRKIPVIDANFNNDHQWEGKDYERFMESKQRAIVWKDCFFKCNLIADKALSAIKYKWIRKNGNVTLEALPIWGQFMPSTFEYLRRKMKLNGKNNPVKTVCDFLNDHKADIVFYDKQYKAYVIIYGDCPKQFKKIDITPLFELSGAIRPEDLKRLS